MPPRKLRPHTADGFREPAGRPLTEVPPPPHWMDDVASKKFVETAEYLVDVRALTAGELPLVEQFGAAYSRWVAAEKLLVAGDPGWRVVLTRQGTEGTAVPTPAMLQSRQSAEQLRKLAAILGLTPVDRAKLPAQRDGGEDDPMDVLLSQRAG
jgi:P27 family predicted phage terminase small subunit